MGKASVFAGGVFIAVLATAAFAAIAGSVAASGNQSTGATAKGACTTTWTVTVSGTDAGKPPEHENKFFKDFHIYPRGGAELDFNSVDMPAGWKKSKASNGGVVFTDDSNNGDGTYAFSLIGNIGDKDAATNDLVDVVMTTTGSKTRSTGDSFGTDTTTRAPCHLASISGTDPYGPYWSAGYKVHVNQISTFTFSVSGSDGAPYQVFRAKEANEDWSDPFALGIEFPSEPVPPAWGLTFTGLVGVMNTSDEASLTVTVPNDLTLVGKVFYLCGTLKDDNGDIVTRVYDIKVTIVE